MSHHILLVIEDEKILPEALIYVRELALRLDGRVTLLMIVPMSFAARTGLGPHRNTIRNIEMRAEKLLSDCQQTFAQEGLAVNSTLKIGDPAQELVKFLADRPPFQSIVWGSGRDLPDKGAGGNRHWLSKVTGSLECPLLTVTKREDEGGNRGEAIMGVLKKFKKSGKRETEIRNFCIQTLRFKKLLENARALIDLFADGREKVAGEYIFDRHYVVSLIDGVIERLGMMAYDACVLVPDRGEAFYSVYDQHKRTARNLIDKGASGKSTGLYESVISAAPGSDDPEYQLLSGALRWFNSAGAPADSTVMDFIRQVFVCVLQRMTAVGGMNSADLFEGGGVRTTDTGMYVIDLWKDARVLPEKRRAAADFNSLPFRHLLRGGVEAGKAGAASPQSGASWVAAVSEHQLSLQSLRADVRFRLETLASGYESSDFIFVFTDKAALLDKIIPRGFHIEGTDYGQCAWSLDMSAGTIEETLGFIGRNIFDDSVWRTP